MGASQSAKHAADDSLLPNGPILRLSGDVWSQVLLHLDYVCIKRLLMTGNGPVRLTVGRYCQVLAVQHVMDSIDFERIVHLCNELPRLQELRVKPRIYETCALKPTKPLILPPTLTSLFLNFAFAMDFGLSILLKQSSLPNLTSLTLIGDTSRGAPIAHPKLPPQLRSLVLLKCPVMITTYGDILKLPRSLTSMSLHIQRMPLFFENCWPPQLESLTLVSAQSVTIELLPRTVTELALSGGSNPLVTRFKDETSGNQFDFPFRRFFPYLRRLTLLFEVRCKLEPLLRSLVSPTAYDSALVDAFISGGHWALPELEDAVNSPYPLFTHLLFHLYEFTSDLVPVLSELAAHLTDLRFLVPADAYVPIAVLQLLPKLRSYKCPSFTGNIALISAPNLAELTVESTTLQSIKNLPKLEVLRAASFKRLRKADRLALSHPWPENLIHIELDSALPKGLGVDLLPSHLIALSFTMTSHHEWTLLATTLVHLEGLKIELNFPGEWEHTEPLEPVRSPYLRELGITLTGSPNRPLPKRFMEEFFGPTCPFPPSLLHLEIAAPQSSNLLIPMTLCPYLPRQLHGLKLGSQIAWSNSFYKSEAPVCHLSPAELVASLPPRLHTLIINQWYKTPTMTHKLLAKLPQTLTHFAQGGDQKLFSCDAKLPTLIKVLPPKLVLLSFLGKRTDPVYFRSRSDLYHGTTPGSTADIQELLEAIGEHLAAVEERLDAEDEEES